VDRPHTMVLRQAVDAVDYRTDPAVVRAQLDAFLPGAPDRVLRLSLMNLPGTDAWIAEAFAAHGYAAGSGSIPRDGALVRFEREEKPGTLTR